MSKDRPLSRALPAILALAAPLLFAHCGSASSDSGVQAGAAGFTAGSGAVEASAGAVDSGGATNGGRGGATNGGSENGGPTAVMAGAWGSAGVSGGGGDSTGTAGSAACAEELLTFSDPNAQHVSLCSAITYPMNPPVYGDHYPVWAAYKSYSFAVPLGFLVHNLEHGAVVLLYNCPEGCADEVAAAQVFLDGLPMDPRCTAEVKHQTVLSPDPTLPSRWAAVAWGHSLTAGCFDAGAFRGFYDANVAHGPEDICADGADLSSDTCL